MRIKKVIGVGVLAGGLGVAAAACGPVNVHWETYPTGTAAALHRLEQHWWVNGGGDDAIFVNQAQATASYDLGYASPAAARSRDGLALEHAAAAAAANPYPGNPSAYGQLMSALEAAGSDLADGNIPGAYLAFEAAQSVAQGAGWSTDFPAPPSGLSP